MPRDDEDLWDATARTRHSRASLRGVGGMVGAARASWAGDVDFGDEHDDAATDPLHRTEDLDAGDRTRLVGVPPGERVATDSGMIETTYGSCPLSPREDKPAEAVTSVSWPKASFFILVVELCERLAFYGATIVFYPYMTNMLGFSQSTANALYNAFTFWAYSACLIGGYVADNHTGRVRAIFGFAFVYIAGLACLFVSALPITWDDFPNDPSNGFAIPGFGVALFVGGLGMGGIKSNVGPLLADQMASSSPEVYASVFRWFYWSINLGSFVGILVTPLLHNNVGEKKSVDPSDPTADLDGTGYWASYLMPLGLFVIALFVFLLGDTLKLYVSHPPAGSLLGKCFRAAKFCLKEKRKNRSATVQPAHWLDWAENSEEHAKAARNLKLSLRACSVFAWYPMYWLCYNQMFSNLVSQAELMDRPDWVAAEALNVVGAFTLIIAIPLFEKVIFPGLRHCGISPNPLQRINFGFLLAAISIIYCGVLEYFIQERGHFDKNDKYIADKARLSIWWQIPPYAIFAASEIFASVGGLEFAYTEAPKAMKSVVMSLFLVTTAAGSLLGLAVSPAIKKSYMVYVFFTFGGVMLLIAILFYFVFRNRKTVTEMHS